MSKAFTRETDVAEPILRRTKPALPTGVKNYMTPHGAQGLRAELERLILIDRPKLLASSFDRGLSESLQTIDQRINQLNQSLQSAEIVEPAVENNGRVRFGATVVVRERSGEEITYRIVGMDEADIDRGWISVHSPLARALLNSKSGDVVRLKFPSVQDLQIVRVAYE